LFGRWGLDNDIQVFKFAAYKCHKKQKKRKALEAGTKQVLKKKMQIERKSQIITYYFGHKAEDYLRKK